MCWVSPEQYEKIIESIRKQFPSLADNDLKINLSIPITVTGFLDVDKDRLENEIEKAVKRTANKPIKR